MSIVYRYRGDLLYINWNYKASLSELQATFSPRCLFPPLSTCPNTLFCRPRGSFTRPSMCWASVVIHRLINRKRSERERRPGIKRKSIGKPRARLSARREALHVWQNPKWHPGSAVLPPSGKEELELELGWGGLVGWRNARFLSGKACERLIKWPVTELSPRNPAAVSDALTAQ